MDTIMKLKWWILSAFIVVLVSVFAVIQTVNQPVQTARKSSVYSITSKESARITNMLRRSIKDCGTWGDSEKVSISNASDFYQYARPYALNTGRLPEQYNGYAVSRYDKRQICMSNYVADDSSMQNADIDYSDRDTMMRYVVDENSMILSSPLNSKITINSNAKVSMTITASWTSTESGLYPIFKSVQYDNGGYEYDNAIDKDTVWKTYSVEHDMNNIKIILEKTDDSWKINGISGGNWDKDGYTNVLSEKVSINDGANRIKTPWEENPKAS